LRSGNFKVGEIFTLATKTCAARAVLTAITVVIVIVGVILPIQLTHAATITWDGGGSDGTCGGNAGDGNKWSCGLNWSGDSAPSSADIVTFDSTSTKNATVDAGFGGVISRINMNSGYSGTITLARSLNITTTFSQAAGTFTAANQDLDIDSSFTLTAGTFTASSSTTTIGTGFTVSGSPTFNANGGTVTFDGGTATLSCNNITFNLVTFNNSNIKTVSSNCSLPLGASPTLGFSVTLAGTLSGSGTLTSSTTAGSTLTLNSGASLSGFSGLVTTGALTLSGATINLGSYTTVDLNGGFTFSSGTFTAPSGIMTLAGTLTISGSPTFNANGGTVTFDGGTATLACNNVSFNLVTFNNTATKTVNSDCSLPLGANPTIPQGITLNGTLSGTGTLATSAGTLTMNASTATLSGFTGLVASGALTVANSATANFGSYTTFTMNGQFAFSSGTVTMPSGTATFNNTFNVTGGTFNANGGTVSFGTGTGVTITCVGVTFNSVSLANAVSKSIASSCNLPLGNNPTTGSTISLSGTLTGTGTLSPGSTLTMNAGATLSGFTGFSASALTVSGATADFSTYSSFAISSNATTLSSGSLTLPGGADLNGSLVISNGTFNAPSGTMTLAGALTISGSPTFNANGGTITFDGAGATLSCNNVTFNLVAFNNTASKTISSNCSLPLGNNPTFTAGFSLSGTLSGSGTLTTGSGQTSTLSTGATLSGFTGLVTNSTFAVAGATVDFSSYTTLTFGTNLTLSTGTLIMPPNASIPGGTLTISGGTFNAPSGTLGVSFLTISGSPTFNNNNGTLNIIGNSAGTFSCNNVTFNRVTFTASATKTINSDCTLPIGSNPTLTGSVILQGTLSGSGTLTSNFTGTSLDIRSAGQLVGFSGLVLHGGLTLRTNASLNLVNYNPVVIYAESTTAALNMVTNSTFTAPSSTMTLHDTINNDGTGTFNHNNGTVEFILSTVNNGTAFIQGTYTFYNLTLTGTDSTQNEIRIVSGTTQTILGALIVQGTSSKPLYFDSDTIGSTAKIDPRGSRTIHYANIRDLININAVPIPAGDGTVADLGNNTGWDFNAPAVTDLGPTAAIDGSSGTDTTPTFYFNLSNHEPGSTVRYELQVDNDPNFSNPEVDYNFGLTTQGTHSFTVGQAANGGTYTAGIEGQTLSTGSYYWQVIAHDEAGNTSGSSRARDGKVAFIIVDPPFSAPSFAITSPKSRQILTFARPYVRFHTASDSNRVVSGYQIILNRYAGSWSNPGSNIVWMKDIDPNKPTKGTIRTTSTAFVSYDGDIISLYGRGSTVALEDGSYRLRVRAVDASGGTLDTNATEFSIKLSGLQTEIIDQTSGTEQTDSTAAGVTPSAGSDATSQAQVKGYTVKIKVVDTNQKPVKGAKVVLHSTPREGTTDSQGLINFSDVEPGDHKVAISYKGQTGEQGITVGSDSATASPEVAITIRIQATNSFTDRYVQWVIGGLVGVIILLLGYVGRKRYIHKEK
jgi:hypothetical protein